MFVQGKEVIILKEKTLEHFQDSLEVIFLYFKKLKL